MFVNCNKLSNQLIFWKSFSVQISKTMIPNELREINFCTGHRRGHIEFKGFQKVNWTTLIKLTSLELVPLPDFHEAKYSRSFNIRNGKRNLTIDFYPEVSQYRVSLLTYSRISFMTEQVTLFSSAKNTTVRQLAKKWTRLSSIKIPPNIDRIGFLMLVKDILFLDKEITSNPRFAKNSKRKNFLFQAFKGIIPQIDWYDVNVECCFGGLIAKDGSRIEGTFSFSKVMHSVHHDASGFVMRYSNEGLSYIYVLGTHSPELLN